VVEEKSSISERVCWEIIKINSPSIWPCHHWFIALLSGVFGCLVNLRADNTVTANWLAQSRLIAQFKAAEKNCSFVLFFLRERIVLMIRSIWIFYIICLFDDFFACCVWGCGGGGCRWIAFLDRIVYSVKVYHVIKYGSC
jgi:hypothetical protein